MSRVQSGKGRWAPAYPTPMEREPNQRPVMVALVLGMLSILVILGHAVAAVLQ